MSRRDNLPGVLVLGCRIQRPDRWWDLFGWWDELGQPVRRVGRRLGFDGCRCTILRHRWENIGRSRCGDEPWTQTQACLRICCRGRARGLRHIEVPG